MRSKKLKKHTKFKSRTDGQICKRILSLEAQQNWRRCLQMDHFLGYEKRLLTAVPHFGMCRLLYTMGHSGTTMTADGREADQVTAACDSDANTAVL